jgi:hypothetical protein
MKQLIYILLFLPLCGFAQGFLLNPYWIESTLLLDEYPGASVAFSLRKLDKDYVGNCIRVRRSSDNAEQNIGFVGNYLDTAALNTFCSGTNGFVTTWYDQSGNTNNATQITAANQPQIISSGSLILEGGKVAMQGTATRGMRTGTITLSSTDYVSLYAVVRAQFSATVQAIFETSTNYNSNNGSCNMFQEGITSYGVGRKTGGYIVNLHIPVINGRTILSAYLNDINNGTEASEIFANNVLRSEYNILNSTTTSFGNYPLHIFARDATSFGLVGTYQEFVFYANDQIANNTAINTKVNSFYAIY